MGKTQLEFIKIEAQNVKDPLLIWTTKEDQ